ncbi:hypothetical protein CRYUN_Cryun03dG0042400 [Craigia yunnanensis]
MDPSLDDTTSAYKLLRCMQIAQCVQENANDMPTMLEVSSMLRNETTPVATPKRPAFNHRPWIVGLSHELHPTKAHTWIKAGYLLGSDNFPFADIKSDLFTHLICAFADLNSSSYQLSVSSSNEQYFSTFTNTAKQKKPSITTLLSIGGGNASYSDFSAMVSNFSSRKSFIDSSIKISRLYGFQGLDFSWGTPNTSSIMSNMATLFEEWRAAIDSETKNSSQSQLILTVSAPYTPDISGRLVFQ